MVRNYEGEYLYINPESEGMSWGRPYSANQFGSRNEANKWGTISRRDFVVEEWASKMV